MKINIYSNNSLFKLAFAFCIASSMVYSTSVQADSDLLKKEQVTEAGAVDSSKLDDEQIELKKDDMDSSFSNSEDKTTSPEKETQLIDNIESTDSSQENIASQSFLTIKNILLIFVIVDIPIIALLLALWFTNKQQQNQQFGKLAKKQNSIIQKLDKLEDINNKISNLDKVSKKIIDKIQENKAEITSSITTLRESIEKPQVFQSDISHNNGYFSLSSDHNISSLTNEANQYQLDTHNYSSVAVADRVPQFVDQYNQNKQYLSNEATAKVSPTEASLNKRRMGDESKLILENTTQKRYLIIQEDGDHFLVPHAKIKINEHNKSSLEALFECISFIPEYSDFHLIQPAKVSQLDSELWQLDKKGKLEFS